MKAVESNELQYSRDQVPERVVHSIGMSQRENVGIFWIFGQDGFPSSKGDARSWTACAPASALQDGVHEVADRVDLGQLRFFHVAPEFLFEAAQQLDALHGVEAEIKIQIQCGPEDGWGRARGFADD